MEFQGITAFLDYFQTHESIEISAGKSLHICGSDWYLEDFAKGIEESQFPSHRVTFESDNLTAVHRRRTWRLVDPDGFAISIGDRFDFACILDLIDRLCLGSLHIEAGRLLQLRDPPLLQEILPENVGGGRWMDHPETICCPLWLGTHVAWKRSRRGAGHLHIDRGRFSFRRWD